MATYITFGLAGAGKTYFANWFATKFNVHFEDADHWITEEMRIYIRDDKIFTPEMLDEYFGIVSANIANLKAKHEHLMISQALYLERNRQQLLSAHPDLIFILVSVNENVLVRRLQERKNGVSLEYARKNECYFESPQHRHIQIDNSADNSDQHLLQQCLQHPEIAALQTGNKMYHFFKTVKDRIKDRCNKGARSKPSS